MKLVKIDKIYINPEKIVALVYNESPDKFWTNIFVGGGEDDYFRVYMRIEDVVEILERVGV